MKTAGISTLVLLLAVGCVENEPEVLSVIDVDSVNIHNLQSNPLARVRLRALERRHNIVGVTYSTPFGTAGTESTTDVAVDSAGNAYFAGMSSSACGPMNTVTIAKMDPSGFNVYYSCLFFGSGAGGMTVDAAGNAYVIAGNTLAKIDPTGSLLIYSWPFTGWTLRDVAIDASGNAYVTGSVTVSGKLSEVLVAKVDPIGAALIYAVSFGGSQNDSANSIAIDGAGNAFITGDTVSTNYPVFNAFQSTLRGSQDAFVTKLNAAGTQILYSTYLGGTNLDYGFGIATDAAGNAWVGGSTSALNNVMSFPVTSGAAQFSPGGSGDGYVAKFNATGGRVYATYLGGSAGDVVSSIAVDRTTGGAYVTGRTSSTNFPIRGSAFQSAFGGGAVDSFVTQLSPTGGSFVYSSYLGGNSTDLGSGIFVDPAKSAYVVGSAFSSNFPSNVYAHSGDFDAFITKFLGP